jgi:hypothetical protein
MFYACRAKPLPDEFLAAPQASSLLSVDNNGPWLRSIPRSHDFFLPIMLEMKRRGPVILKTDSKGLLQKLCRPL